MDILLYSPYTNGIAERLQQAVGELVPEEKIGICRTINSLSNHFRQPLGPRVVILLTDDESDLSELVSIRDLLWDVRIILILPDRKEGTIAKGHTLRPRFLSYADSDPVEVVTVLGKMLRKRS